MSWSISYIGVPDKINAKMEEYSASLTGQSKEEFDEAKPHLQALVAANVPGLVGTQLIKLDASGHANFTDGKKTYGICSVTVQQFYGTVLI